MFATKQVLLREVRKLKYTECYQFHGFRLLRNSPAESVAPSSFYLSTANMTHVLSTFQSNYYLRTNTASVMRRNDEPKTKMYDPRTMKKPLPPSKGKHSRQQKSFGCWSVPVCHSIPLNQLVRLPQLINRSVSSSGTYLGIIFRQITETFGVDGWVDGRASVWFAMSMKNYKEA